MIIILYLDIHFSLMKLSACLEDNKTLLVPRVPALSDSAFHRCPASYILQGGVRSIECAPHTPR